MPTQVGFLPKNIAMSQNNKWTIKDYFNVMQDKEQSSSSHDNPALGIPMVPTIPKGRYHPYATPPIPEARPIPGRLIPTTPGHAYPAGSIRAALGMTIPSPLHYPAGPDIPQYSEHPA
eukprot:9903221-Heterocapsa_arctica.AAC.1